MRNTAHDRPGRCLVPAAAACLLLVAGFASAAGNTPIELDSRYSDPLNGFSLRPPAGAEVRKQPSASKVVTWSMRDPKTNAIAWTFTVQRAIEEEPIESMERYAKSVAAKLRQDDKFALDRLAVRPIAKHAGFDLQGVSSAVVKLWQRQLWVLLKAKRLLIFTISGPITMKDRLNAICTQILQTIRLQDPDKFIELRRKACLRGQEAIAGLRHHDVVKKLSARPQYFLMQFKGKPVGWMVQAEKEATIESKKGIEVTTWMMAQLPESPPRMMKKQLFGSVDREFERWIEVLRIPTKAGTQVRYEQGLRSGPVLIVQFQTRRRPMTVQKKIPKDFYLPKALNAVLPKLLDLSKPAMYAFAVYSGDRNTFDMRTLTVVGPDSVEHNGSKTAAIKVTDQSNYDSDEVTAWYDRGGQLLRMVSPDGFTMEARTRADLIRRYPDLDKTISDMAKPVSRTPANR